MTGGGTIWKSQNKNYICNYIVSDQSHNLVNFVVSQWYSQRYLRKWKLKVKRLKNKSH